MEKKIKHNSFNLHNVTFFVIDILICVCGYALSALITNPVDNFIAVFRGCLIPMLITTLSYVILLGIFQMYSTMWTQCNEKDCVYLVEVGLIATAIGSICGILLTKNTVGYKEIITAHVIIFGAIACYRFAIRILAKLLRSRDRTPNKKRILIIGSGNLAVVLLKDIENNPRLNYKVVGLIDDDTSKLGLRVYGVEVVGNRNDIVRLSSDLNIDEIIFAIYNVPMKTKVELLDICSRTGKKIKILEGVEKSLNEGNSVFSGMRDIEIEDLLERDPMVLDNELISQDIGGKVVLVTGGGGSIGSELCRQIIKHKPKTLIILDIYENTTYELQNELSENYPGQHLEVLIASIRDEERLDNIFETYKPELVFHAAAHKHVPLMEFSPGEAIKNNVFGTLNCAKCASKHGVKRFVMISTDKAVNPTNVMGASKRMCEMIIQTIQKKSNTNFALVRFGNVLGSNGSVIPRFKKQIAQGGPLTVTHPDITRFFMTIPEAAQLVLQAASYAKGGEIFILDMGKPVRIYDLARKIIKLSGFRPDVDIEIKFTGLRPGEKLYEELLMNEEGIGKTAHSKIFVGKPIELSYEELEEKLEILRNVEYSDTETIKNAIADVVPTYKAARNKNKDI